MQKKEEEKSTKSNGTMITTFTNFVYNFSKL